MIGHFGQSFLFLRVIFYNHYVKIHKSSIDNPGHSYCRPDSENLDKNQFHAGPGNTCI